MGIKSNRNSLLCMVLILLAMLTLLFFSGCENLGKSKKYTISFESNNEQVIDSISAGSGEIVNLPQPNSYNGFAFDGWYLAEDFSGHKYQAGEQIGVTENLKFYAKWKIKEYERVTIYRGKNIIYEEDFLVGDTLTREYLIENAELPFGEIYNLYLNENHTDEFIQIESFAEGVTLYATINFYEVIDWTYNQNINFEYFDDQGFSLDGFYVDVIYQTASGDKSHRYNYDTHSKWFNFTPPREDIPYGEPHDINLIIGNIRVSLPSFVRKEVKPQRLELISHNNPTEFYYEYIELDKITVILHYNNNTQKTLEKSEYTISYPAYTVDGEYDVEYIYLDSSISQPLTQKFKVSLYKDTPESKFKYETHNGEKIITGIVDNSVTYLSIPLTIEGMSVTKIAPNAFENSTAIKTVNIPSSVVFVGANAFKGCENLIQVFGGIAVTSIQKSTFEGCVNLIGISYFSQVTSVFDRGLYNCANLQTSVHTLDIIGESSFYGCKKLSTVIIPYAKELKANAFAQSEIEYLSFEYNTENFIISVNSGCEQALQNAQVGNITANTAANNLAFLQGMNIKKWVIIGRSIPQDTFIDNKYITQVEIVSTGDFTIGMGAFRGCSNLATISLPDTIMFEQDCFVGTKITSLEKNNAYFRKGALSGSMVNSIKFVNVTADQKAFEKNDNLQSVVVETMRSNGDGIFLNCTGLKQVNISNIFTYDEETSKYISGTLSNSFFKNCSSLLTVDMPNIVIIGENAFEGCTTLDMLQLKNVKTIKANAFLSSNISEIAFGENLREVADSAFLGVPLAVVTFENNLLFYVDNNVLYENVGARKNLVKVLSGFSGTELSLPEDCRKIYSGAFEYANTIKDIFLCAYYVPTFCENLLGENDITLQVNPFSYDGYIAALPGYLVQEIDVDRYVMVLYYHEYKSAYSYKLLYLGEKIEQPTIPQEDSGVFGKWVASKKNQQGETIEVDVEFPLTAQGHIMLIAKPKEGAFMVKFSLEDVEYSRNATQLVTTQDVENGKKYTLPNIVKKGYVIDFWFVDENENGKFDEGEMVVTENTPILPRGHIVIPQMTRTNTYKINGYNNSSSEKNVSIDLSSDVTNLTIQGDTQYIEIFSNRTVLNFNITASERVKPLVIVIKNLYLSSNCLDLSLASDVVVYYLGSNTFIGKSGTAASRDGKTAMQIKDATFIGNGSISVYGGNGYGSDVAGVGGNAMHVTNSLAFLGSGKLSLYGGDGGNGNAGANGTDGTAASVNATMGKDGFNGGNGGYGLFAQDATINVLADFTVRGGDGGSGGSGGNGGEGYNYDRSNYNAKNHKEGSRGGNGSAAGKGGDGGKSGIAILCGVLKVNPANFIFQAAKSGDGGAGGRGGDGGDGQGGTNGKSEIGTPSNGRNGGSGGSGNIGGNGGNTYDRRIAIVFSQSSDLSSTYHNNSGNVGGIGSGGAGGLYGYKGIRWFWGSDGKNGTNGVSPVIENGKWTHYDAIPSYGSVLTN